MKAHVDKDACIACELCPSICPEIFVMDDDGLATTIKEEVPESLEDSASEAAAECPTDAIHIN